MNIGNKYPQIGGGNSPFLGKNESKWIAGIAVLFMVWHHLFAFPDWLLEGLKVKSAFGHTVDSLVWLSARLGDICIYIFAFSSGFVLYKRWSLFDTLKKRSTRIWAFLRSYWMVCMLFWLVGWWHGESLPTWGDAALNMVGLGTSFYTPWINVILAWYVFYYIIFLGISPVLYRCFQSDNKPLLCFMLLGFILVLFVLAKMGIVYWKPFMSSVTGILTAKYEWFEKLYQLIGKWVNRYRVLLPTLVATLAVRAALLYLQHAAEDNVVVTVVGSVIEGTIAFSFIFLVNIGVRKIQKEWLNSFLLFMGNLSMFLWFTHSLLFTGSRFLQRYVYFSSDPIIIYGIALICFVPLSYLLFLLDQFIRNIRFLKGRVE